MKKRRGFDFQAARRIEIERTVRVFDLINTDDAQRFLVAWHWHNASNTKDPVGSLMLAVNRMGGNITEEQAEQMIQEAATTRQRRSADALARYLGIADEMRRIAGLKTIGSIDVNKRQRARRRKELARVAEQNRRKARGAKPHSGSARRNKPWKKNGVGRSTYYKRKRAEAAGGPIHAQSPLTPTIQPRGPFRAQSAVLGVPTKWSTASRCTKQEAGERGLATTITAKPKPAVFVEGAVRHVPCGTNDACHEFVQQRSRR
jgi:hypothetical protein